MADPLTYSLFGLRVRSEIPLPELPRADDGEGDVEIRLGGFPVLAGERENAFSMTAEGAVLNVPDTARYAIRDGRSIMVDPHAGGSSRNVRLFLLGSAFGTILHQRGLLPLHANSIELGGRAVAFLGPSGAGKSTMAAWFHDRGYEILADDVCVITFGADGRPMAQPGIPRLRLWRDALEASGRDAGAHDHAFDDADKYNVPTRQRRDAEAVPLAAAYMLDTAETGAEAFAIERRRGMAAVETLVANTYRGGYLPLLGGVERHLASCVALANAIPTFAISRRWGRDHLDRQLAELEAHLQENL